MTVTGGSNFSFGPSSQFDEALAELRRYLQDEIPSAPMVGTIALLMAQPPGYKKLAIGWIMQAKKEETRLKRLRIIMDASAKGTRTRWM